MKRLVNTSLAYLILGLTLGFVYRELTQMLEYTGPTELSVLHTHTLTLGFMFHLILLALEKPFKLTETKNFNLIYWLYQVSLLGLLSTLGFRGYLTMIGSDFAGLSHIAGTFHTLIAVSLVWLMLNLKKQVMTN